MEIPFVKFQGAGNDFVMIDNRSGKWDHLSLNRIRTLCNRKYGVGADGLIKINTSADLDFEVDYYNADGSRSFCGNGARCAVAFAKTKGVNTSFVRFKAIDGVHEASQVGGIISLLMNDVDHFSQIEEDFELNTGSPHYVRFIDDVTDFPVFEEGVAIRYAGAYKEKGINVNFVQILEKNQLFVLTYERGVEDETLSCGTGVTAAAIAFAVKNQLYGEQLISIQTKGGQLQVTFNRVSEHTFNRIYLIGPALPVFEGVFYG